MVTVESVGFPGCWVTCGQLVSVFLSGGLLLLSDVRVSAPDGWVRLYFSFFSL